MSSRLYETFCDLLESLPVKAIVRAADAERRMVQNDLRMRRISLDDYCVSVLEFCNFVVDSARGWKFSQPLWPAEHSEFYRGVVRRLVEAGELPAEVLERLESPMFCSRDAHCAAAH